MDKYSCKLKKSINNSNNSLSIKKSPAKNSLSNIFLLNYK